MVAQQLTDYIRQSLANNFARADIEKALLAAGWAAQDISEGFMTIQTPGAVAPPAVSAPVLQGTSTSDNAAETARIQHELELEAKRQRWRGATVSTPIVGGIIGWLIRKKIVEGELQANISLLGVAIIASVLAVGIYIWSSNASASRPAVTAQELQEIQKMQHMSGSTQDNTSVSP